MKCCKYRTVYGRYIYGRYVVSLQTLVAVQKRVVWQLECQAGIVTLGVQSEHHLRGYCEEIQPMSQQAAATTRAYCGLVLGILHMHHHHTQ